MRGVLGTLFRPWRTAATWRSLTHLTLDALSGTISFSVVFTLGVTALSLLIVFPLAVPVIWLTFQAAHVVARVERSRAAALLDLELEDPCPRIPGDTWWRRFLARFRSVSRWKEIGFSLLHQPVGLFTTITAIVVWCGSAALLALPLYVGALPEDTAHFGLFDVRQGPATLLVSAVGLVGLALVAPWTTVGLANLDRAVDRWLLGRSERAEFEERVSELEESRSAAVDSAEAERRRIERDLHDGAQQRLIAVAMDLGVARSQLESDPDKGRELVAEAHDEVKAALRELRDLVRGIHPVILEDRGLDAALSAVVARCPVPVELRVEVPTRPSPAVESAAYFIVSEALTNVARHAEATRASVEIARRSDRLTIVVTDDGVGGADAARGTGLAGLEERVVGLGGWMQVVSPAGGPTTLLVEVPCGS